MKLTVRAASIAAVTVCAVTTCGFTAPSLALELDKTPIVALNVVTPASVPTPPPPVLPPELTPERSLDEDTGASATPAVAASGDYDSLADAVAAQGTPAELDEELTCLAIGVYYEAKGEPLSGQLAVADVILNRSQSHRFPRSVCSVLKQRGQFSFVRSGRLPDVSTGSRAWKTAVAVARVARDDLWKSAASDALFFHARYVSPRWRLAKVATVGNHVFYR